MWPFKKRIHQRRLEVRKNIPTQRGAVWRRFVKAGGLGSVGIALGVSFVVALLTVLPGRTLPYRVRDVMGKRYARISFAVPSEELTKQAQEKAKQETPLSYDLNESLMAEISARLESLPAEAKSITDLAKIPAALQNQFAITAEQDLQLFAVHADPPLDDAWRAAVGKLLEDIRGIVILTPEDERRERKHDVREFHLGRNGTYDEQNKSIGFAPFNRPRDVDPMLRALTFTVEPPVAERVRGYLIGVISAGRPTYRFAPKRTENDRAAAVARVPVQTLAYATDEVIFRGGALAADDLTVLAAEHKAWQDRLSATDPGYQFRIAAGRVAMALLAVAGLCAYIALYQKRVVANHVRGLALAVLLITIQALTAAMVMAAGWNAYLAAGMAMMGAVIVTVAYGRRFALAVAATFAVLLALQLGRDIGFLLALIAPVAVSVLLLREIRTRSKVIKVGAVAAATAFATTAITNLATGHPFGIRLIVDCGWAAGGVMVMGFILQGILPMVERIFHIATALTLLEWCDADKKLLKRLALEAPGTFNHSLLLGTLCEAAAEAVGANGLLARVGAYYHDIGKINKPEYFVENQFGSPSKHAKLSPAMSLLIITGHVKDGIEMAKEYGLPPVLHQFIAGHHGTALVQYFYHAATEQRKGNGSDRPPEEAEFRYPGPKPQSKEVAILMLADATESSVRAMPDPTPARIEAQAGAILHERLTDGQLDECDLTLRAAHKIEQSLVKSLCGIYHGRIAYPKSETKSVRRSGATTAEA